MWTTTTTDLPARRGLHFAVAYDSRPATYGDVLRGWRDDGDFRSLFSDLLAGVAYSAFRWETPGVSADTVTRPFEFVVFDSPSLDRRPDPDGFAEHFADATDDVAVFPNLGGDAVMIVPCPVAGPSAYGHLAAFVRHAPEHQRHALWRAVAATLAARLSTRPVWLSTAGAGVAWLHIRVDDGPKYYGHGPYRRIA